MVERLRRSGSFWFIFSILALISSSCSPFDPGIFVESQGRYIAMGALNDASCGALLSAQWPTASAEVLAQYRTAIRKGEIVPIESGTKVKEVEVLFYENGTFIRPYPTTEREMKDRKVREAAWVIPKEGRLRGKRLCVSNAVIRASYPPL